MIVKHGMLHIKNSSRLDIMLGIHNSHFAVESILRWKARDYRFNSSLSKIGFDEIIKKVNEKQNIPNFEDLLLLNTTRNNIQHKFLYPQHDQAAYLCKIAENYLKWSYKVYFNVDYDSLKLEDMIYDGDIKRLMLESKNHIKDENLKDASLKMYKGLAKFKSVWFDYLSDWRVRGWVFKENLDMANLLADLAFKIILSEDLNTLKKMLAIQSRHIMKDGEYLTVYSSEALKFEDKEEAVDHYDTILNIILNYQDKIPIWNINDI